MKVPALKPLLSLKMDPLQLQNEAHCSRLEAAERLVTQCKEPEAASKYAAALMHEIAIPLEALNNLVFVAREDTEHRTAYLDMVQRQLERLNELVRRTARFCQTQTPD